MRLLPLSVLLLPALIFPDAALAQVAPATGGKGARSLRRVFENYDLRVSNPGEPAAKADARAAYRAKAPASSRAASPESIAAARASLAERIPTLQMEMNLAGRVPEVVGVASGEAFLTAPSKAARESVARDFLFREAAVFGLTTTEVATLVKFTDYANPAGNMSWVEFRQDVLGIPVFQGELRAAFTAAGALARTTGNLVPGIDPAALDAKPKLTPAEATAKAAAMINVYADPAQLTVKWTEENGRRSVLSGGPFDGDTRAELTWFPVEPGVAVLAWSVTLWRPVASYWVIVDANDGTILWRKKVTQHQTQQVTYSVYISDSPAPLSPTNVLPGQGTQAPAVARTLVRLVADNLNASPLGWITDGNSTTLGNNVTAGLDLSAPNGVDANVTGSAFRVFNFPYNPSPGLPLSLGSNDPTDADYRNGAVTNAFFWANRYHDRLWQLGFTEAARNFQTDNFGRGGSGGDAISVEVQDYAGSLFTTFADGNGPRLELKLLSFTSPPRDRSLDVETIIHELTHGASNRLHSNASGLFTAPSDGMGEGWSDFYARALLATATEDVNAVYAHGAYTALNSDFTGEGSVGTDNYYYGLRRFPYAVKSNVGANGKPHNPLTLADIDAAKINLTDGAYPPSPAFATAPASSADSVQFIGEVWCMMLLEFRARLINRLGFAVGNQRALQIVTDAMKLDPVSPTLIQGRDSVVAAAYAGVGGAADAADAFAAFALRGAGTGATCTNSSPVTVTESFTAGVFAGAITFSDAAGNNNGAAEPGEIITFTVPVVNPGPTTVSPVTVTVNGRTGTIPSLGPGASASVAINDRIPAGTACGALLSLPVTVTAASFTSTLSYSLRVGTVVMSTILQNFDGLTAPTLPAGWTTTNASGTPWVTTAAESVDGSNSAYAPALASAGESSLFSPPIPIPAGGANLAFRHRRVFESDINSNTTSYDGGVLEISIPGVAFGTFRDILAAGGSFIQNGYSGTLSSGFNNPLAGRQAFTGTTGILTTLVALPAAANGQSVRFRWRLGSDSNFGSTGWNVDTVGFAAYACGPADDADGDGLPDAYELANGLNPANPADATLDSDGDGMTNLAEFRAGTDPRSPADVLRASVSRDADGNPVVSFPSVGGLTYVVEYKDDLAATDWTPLQSDISGTGSPINVPDSIVGTAPQRFYRARVVTP